MKKVIGIMLALMLLLAGCAQAPLSDVPAEDTPTAVQKCLVDVFGMPGDAALAELGLQDAPYDEEAGGVVSEYEWCGEKLQTVINPDWTGTGEVIMIRARTEHTVTPEDVSALSRYVECFAAQFGTPINYSTEISGEGRFGYSYEESSLQDILGSFAKQDADCALTFRFLLPERTEEDLEFAECAFYKSCGSDTVSVSLHLLRLSEPDYEVAEASAMTQG